MFSSLGINLLGVWIYVVAQQVPPRDAAVGASAQPMDLTGSYQSRSSAWEKAATYPWRVVPRGSQTLGNVPLTLDGMISLWGGKRTPRTERCFRRRSTLFLSAASLTRCLSIMRQTATLRAAFWRCPPGRPTCSKSASRPSAKVKSRNRLKEGDLPAEHSKNCQPVRSTTLLRVNPRSSSRRRIDAFSSSAKTRSTSTITRIRSAGDLQVS
jgi:hypothetical protein